VAETRLLAGERVLLTLWVGGLWAVGYMVAPALFVTLQDRALAGSLAGVMFGLMARVGLVCGGLLLLFNQMRNAGSRCNWRALVLLAMLLLVAAGEFLLTPMIAELRTQGLADSPQFARLHGIAAGGYLVTSLLGLSLVIARPEAA
jgi:hypothetical protein